jgi:hypothetical protein
MKKIIILASLLFSLTTAASIVPKNDLYIPVNQNKSMLVTGVADEAEFNKVISDIEAIYKPIFKEKYKANLVVIKKWEDGTVNAYANQSGKNWNVHMFGGLARHAATTPDGFMAVVCHEIGHHIGGAPKINRWGTASWASNEGQADYFATSKCLRKYFEKDREETIKRYEAEASEESSYAKEVCDKANSSLLESAICYRSALAGKSLAVLLGTLGGTPNVSFKTTDNNVVEKTNDKHPKAQCRLDTYFQGALCGVDHIIFPSQSDAAVGFCNRKDGYEIGIRPLCWLKPSQHGL